MFLLEQNEENGMRRVAGGSSLRARHRRQVGLRGFEAGLRRSMVRKEEVLSHPAHPVREPDPNKVLARRNLLTFHGLLPGLENGQHIEVILPGGCSGIAIGISKEAGVIIEGWKEPFVPEIIEIKK